jgi:hypothetical protein
MRHTFEGSAATGTNARNIIVRSAEYDLRFLQAGLELLEEYLLSNDLYWPIGVGAPVGEPPYPQFNLGSLELALTRVPAFRLTAAQQTQLDDLTAQINDIRARWRTNWGEKARAEFHGRLNLWRDFLMDYQESPESNYDRYAYEVNRRVQLKLLREEAERISYEEIKLLDSLDRLLEASFQPGEFVWEAELSSSFPPQIYWYLYGNVKK